MEKRRGKRMRESGERENGWRKAVWLCYYYYYRLFLVIYFAIVNWEEGRNVKRRVVIPTNLNGTHSSPPKVKTVSGPM